MKSACLHDHDHFACDTSASFALSHDEVVAQIKAAGFKVTKPRTVILAGIAKAAHPVSAEELFVLLQEDQISLATIYRTLAHFTQKNLISRDMSTEGIALYRLTQGAHHHYLRCQKCGERIVIDLCPLQYVEQEIAKETGYVITGHSLEMTGICPRCAAHHDTPEQH